MSEYYHDAHCSADRRKPMGCKGCSCIVSHKAQMWRATLQHALDDVDSYWDHAFGGPCKLDGVVKARQLLKEIPFHRENHFWE